MSSAKSSQEQHVRPTRRNRLINKLATPPAPKQPPQHDCDNFKIGEKVFYRTDNKSEGVVVGYLKSAKKPWSVHWYLPPTIKNKKYNFDRGVYTTKELKGYYVQ
jgi:hypothetical protein